MDQDALVQRLEALNALLANDKRAVVHIERKPTTESIDTRRTSTDLTSCPAAAAAAAAHAADQIDPATRDHIAAWGELLGTWDHAARKRPKRLAELVEKGIPAPMRGMAWQKLAQLHREQLQLSETASEPALEERPHDMYHALLEQPSSYEKQIHKDIKRTYPEEDLFKGDKGEVGRDQLFNVIKAYSLYDTDVGYCQGSPFIVGLMLFHLPERDAFDLFAAVMADYKLRGLFRPNMADLNLCLYQLESLVRQDFPALAQHFDNIDLRVSMFATQWFLTLFGAVLPLEVAFRLFDLFLLDGLVVVFKASLAILSDCAAVLMRQCFEDALASLARPRLLERYAGRADQLVAALGQQAVAPKRLLKLERNYLVFRQQEQARESELTKLRDECARLRAENSALVAKVNALEKETQTLAASLISKAVMLNDHTEEIFELRYQLGLRAADTASVGGGDGGSGGGGGGADNESMHSGLGDSQPARDSSATARPTLSEAQSCSSFHSASAEYAKDASATPVDGADSGRQAATDGECTIRPPELGAS